MRARNDESLQSLAKLRRLPADDERVQEEWKGILADVRFQREVLEKEHPNTTPFMLEIKQWVDLFRPKYFKRTIVAVAIPFFQQVSLVHNHIPSLLTSMSI